MLYVQMKGEETQMNKPHFIAQNVFLAFFLFVCLFGVVWFAFYKIPAESSLQYEDCRFVSCEYRREPIRNGYIARYDLTVEEYEEPLRIAEYVHERMDVELLDAIEPGDVISIEFRKEDGYRYVYSLEYGGKSVFSYEEYIATLRASNRGYLILFSIGALFFTGIIVAGIIYYQHTGKTFVRLRE